jgi:CHAT domain-containing protein/predicted negative regulator of RcsB-dependent stress response
MGTFKSFRSVMARPYLAVVAVALTVLVPGFAGGQTVLDDRSSEERVLAPGEKQTFIVRLTAGEFIRLGIESELPQLSAVLRTPAGHEITSRLRSNVNNYAETISAIAAASGDHGLIIESKWLRPGRYTLRVLEHRPAVLSDRDRIEAEKSYAEGRRLLREATPDSIASALVDLERALALFHKLDDDGAVADAENDIGAAYSYRLGEFQRALPHLLAALALRQCLPDASACGTSMDHVGDVFRVMGDARKAIKYFEAALPMKNPEVPREVAITLRNLAMTHDDIGDAEAVPQYMKLLVRMREAGEPIGEGFVQHSIALHFCNSGEWQEALEHAREALRVWKSADFRAGQNYATVLLGLIYQERGEPERALTYYKTAATMPNVADTRSTAEATWRISTVYQTLGEIDRAIDQQQQALKTFHEKGDAMMEAKVLLSLGDSHVKKGEAASALESYEEALRIISGVNYPADEGIILESMAAAQLELGKREQGHKTAGRAIEIFHAVHYPPGEASARLIRARIEQADGDLDAALSDAGAAIALIEKLRGHISTPENRAMYVASAWETYEFYVDLLMRLDREAPGKGFDAIALRASEQSRARSLLDLLAEPRMEAPQRAGTARLQQIRSLRGRISAKAQAQLKLAGNQGADADAIQHELEDLNGQYEQLVADIRRDDPALAAVASPEPLNLSQIQREVVDSSTVLLEYSLGEARSFLWVVTPDRLLSYELPPRKQIEAAVRTAYEALSSRSGLGARLESLSEMILAPAASAIHAKRLVIVPDGALQYLPFTTLLSPETGQPLIAEHEIVTLPSASTIAILRRLPRAARTTRSLAVFADPVFDRNDSRLSARLELVGSMESSRGVDDDQVESALERSARESGLNSLPRLPFTRREATTVLSLVAPSQRKEALDFAASRAAVLSPDLREYRFVHFATHGLLNNFHPELSGIVLSMVDEKGKEQNGFLSTADVFNLSLGADLVVLSGCRTGLGKEIRGEGIAGLTRAFIYAGAPRVVASLWNVNDAATAELMKRFYQGMLGPKKLAPSAALRAAQLSLQKEPRWSAPYYWAAFVIQGEWN